MIIFQVCPICYKGLCCDKDSLMGRVVLILQYVPFVLRIHAVAMILQWEGCAYFLGCITCFKDSIMAFSSLLYENKNKKKISDKMLPLGGIEPRPLIPNPSCSFLSHLGVCYWGDFCSCIDWFLDFFGFLDDSVRINRAWLYKDPKV